MPWFCALSSRISSEASRISALSCTSSASALCSRLDACDAAQHRGSVATCAAACPKWMVAGATGVAWLQHEQEITTLHHRLLLSSRPLGPDLALPTVMCCLMLAGSLWPHG
jgi:hypothetical protein